VTKLAGYYYNCIIIIDDLDIIYMSTFWCTILLVWLIHVTQLIIALVQYDSVYKQLTRIELTINHIII